MDEVWRLTPVNLIFAVVVLAVAVIPWVVTTRSSDDRTILRLVSAAMVTITALVLVTHTLFLPFRRESTKLLIKYQLVPGVNINTTDSEIITGPSWINDIDVKAETGKNNLQP
jgi:hypothetical protein